MLDLIHPCAPVSVVFAPLGIQLISCAVPHRESAIGHQYQKVPWYALFNAFEFTLAAPKTHQQMCNFLLVSKGEYDSLVSPVLGAAGEDKPLRAPKPNGQFNCMVSADVI